MGASVEDAAHDGPRTGHLPSAISHQPWPHIMLIMADQVALLHSLFASGELVHPYLRQEYFSKGKTDDDGDVASFVDLSAAIAMCCGASPPSLQYADENGPMSNESVQKRRMQLAVEIGGVPTKDDNGAEVYPRKHIVLILCDGMGNSCLEKAFASDEDVSFLMNNNQPTRMCAVFPSTTPAALTSLATASYPGSQHGMPGWNLRDKSGCDFPGADSDSAGPVVQLLVLSDHIRDARSGELASKHGFETWDSIFVEVPWSRSLLSQSNHSDDSDETEQYTNCTRKMLYINAYNGDDYQNWSQGATNDNDNDAQDTVGTDFSSWQMGIDNQDVKNISLFDTAKIEETAYDTLGVPRGSSDAIRFFRDGVNAALKKIAEAERRGESTFTYLYTAHPDKHMHALGVENEEVKKVIQGLDSEIRRFWRVLGNRDALLARTSFDDDTYNEDNAVYSVGIDATIVITADHGHITVEPEHMITLPHDILECCEYANIGVHGKVSVLV